MKAISTPKEVEAREERRIAVPRDLRDEDEHDRERGGDDDRLARDERTPLEPRELARQGAVLGEGVGQASDARDGGRRGRDQDEDPRDPDRDAQRIDRGTRSDPSKAAAIPTSGASSRLPSELGRAVGRRVRGEADRGDRDGDDDHGGRLRRRASAEAFRPGSRASSARFAAVSRPVYASIANGRAKARSLQCCPLANPKAGGERVRREEEHVTSTTSTPWTTRSSTATASDPAWSRVPWPGARRR